MLRRGLLLLVLAAACLAGCGGDDRAAAPGSPQNPLAGEITESGPGAGREPTEPAAAAKPGEPDYQKLLEQQTTKPQERFSPCNLVAPARARAILGKPMQTPVEAPQGPTCIYRPRSGHRFVTLAVQSGDIHRLKRQMTRTREVTVSDRVAVCGTLGQSVLYLPLSAGRVLSVSAPCGVAQRFAAAAARQLSA